MAELAEIADSKGVGDLFRQAVETVGQAFDATTTTRTTVAFIGNINGSRNTIFSLEPIDSDDANGMKFYLYRDRFLAYFGLQETALDELQSLLQFTEDDRWSTGNTILRG